MNCKENKVLDIGTPTTTLTLPNAKAISVKLQGTLANGESVTIENCEGVTQTHTGNVDTNTELNDCNTAIVTVTLSANSPSSLFVEIIEIIDDYDGVMPDTGLKPLENIQACLGINKYYLENFRPALNRMIPCISSWHTSVVSMLNTTQELRDETEGFKDETNTIKSETQTIKNETNTIKSETQTIKDEAVTETGEIRDEIATIVATLDNGSVISDGTIRNDTTAWSSLTTGLKLDEITEKLEGDPDFFSIGDVVSLGFSVQSPAWQYFDIARFPNSNRFAVVANDKASSRYVSIICGELHDDGTWSWGNKKTYSLRYARRIAVTAINSTQLIIGYGSYIDSARRVYGRVVTVSGVAVSTIGAEFIFPTNNNEYSVDFLPLTASRFVAVAGDSIGIYDITGTMIVQAGDPVALPTNSTNSWATTLTKQDDTTFFVTGFSSSYRCDKYTITGTTIGSRVGYPSLFKGTTGKPNLAFNNNKIYGTNLSLTGCEVYEMEQSGTYSMSTFNQEFAMWQQTGLHIVNGKVTLFASHKNNLPNENLFAKAIAVEDRYVGNDGVVSYTNSKNNVLKIGHTIMDMGGQRFVTVAIDYTSPYALFIVTGGVKNENT